MHNSGPNEVRNCLLPLICVHGWMSTMCTFVDYPRAWTMASMCSNGLSFKMKNYGKKRPASTRKTRCMMQAPLSHSQQSPTNWNPLVCVDLIAPSEAFCGACVGPYGNNTQNAATPMSFQGVEYLISTNPRPLGTQRNGCMCSYRSVHIINPTTPCTMGVHTNTSHFHTKRTANCECPPCYLCPKGPLCIGDVVITP